MLTPGIAAVRGMSKPDVDRQDGDVRFNGDLLRTRRLELGLSERRLAAPLGAGFSVTILRSLEAGTNDDELTIAGLRRLAAALDLAAGDLLIAPRRATRSQVEPPAGPTTNDDHLAEAAATAGALLTEIHRPTPDQVLAELVDVNLDELEKVLAVLDSVAGHAGLHLRRVHRTTALVPSATGLTAEVTREAWRQHLGRCALDRGEAFVLAEVQRGQLGQNIGNDTRNRAASLVNAGVLERNASGGFELSSATRFSLCLDAD